MKTLTLILGVVTLAALLAACDGDGDDAEPTPLPADIVLTPVAGMTPVQTLTILDDNGTPAAAPTVSGPGAELLALMNHGLTASYRVRYRTSSQEGEGDSFAVYNMPPLVRIDAVDLGATSPSSILLIRDGERFVNCTPAGSGGWHCSELDPFGSAAIVSLGPSVYPDASTFETAAVTEVDGRSIAGEAARCFGLTEAGAEPLAYCVTNDGVVLNATASDETVEAVEFSRAVTAEDFKLPK